MLIKINYSKVIFLSLYLVKGIIMTFILLSAVPLGKLGSQYINNISTKTYQFTQIMQFFSNRNRL